LRKTTFEQTPKTKIMKNLFALLFAAACCLLSIDASAQCNGRYYDEVFPKPDVFITILGIPLPDVSKLNQTKVTYGSAEGQNLEMYVLQPEGDTAEKRPLVMLAFGGSFTAGFKESPDIIKLCQEFTARGFVTVSIDYRLLPGTSPIDSANMLKQVVKAVQDTKAAIRYFYQDAATTNTYKIDTNKIFVGGTSAGAFIGIHLAYLTDTVGIQQWMKDIIASQGELEGTSGNPGYSSRVAGVINLAGAIGDTAWIDAGEAPMVSMHGNQDGTVPYCSEIINVSGNDIIVVDGSATIKARTVHLGIKNSFYTWRNADHVPYVDPTPTSEGPAYMDTTVWFVRNFLYEQMTGIECGQALAAAGKVSAPCGYPIEDTTNTGIEPVLLSGDFSVYPNPSSDVIYIEKPNEITGSADVEVYDNIGRRVKSYHNIPNTFTISKKELGAGVFIVKMIPANKSLGIARTKVVFE